MFYPGSHIRTFFESCGIGDLIATCYGGRNRAVCEAMVKTKKVFTTKNFSDQIFYFLDY